MKNLEIRIIIVGVIAQVLLAYSVAEAAKGVKKNATNDHQRTVAGVVTSITPDGKGGGAFQLRTAVQHKKNVTANAVGLIGDTAKNQKNVTFNVSSATQFHHISGAVVNGSMVNLGTHVRVHATGNDVQNIVVLTHFRPTGNVMRHRANTYSSYIHRTPHLHHHHHTR